MDSQKKSLEISGRLLSPLKIGAAAMIAEKDGVRRTSRVLSMKQISEEEIRFETLNTCYLLHITEVVQL